MRYCIFTGLHPGIRPEYRNAAKQLGTLLAQAGIGLVYGGASIGLMGEVADAALAAGGEVIGVLPQFLKDREVVHSELTELRIVATMHERKALMAELSDAFIALPGGAGTLEEIFEVWTWRHLSQHNKPCALLNTEGFYDPLLAFLRHTVDEGFLPEGYRRTLLVRPTPETLLEALNRINSLNFSPIEPF